MKTAVLLSIFSVTTSLMAQLALTPSQPAIQGISTALVPGSPAITPPPLPSTASVSQAATNLTLEQVSSLLTNLQSILEDTLPLLTAFNDGFDFVAVDTNGVPASTPLAVGGGSSFAMRFANGQAAGAPLPPGLPVTNNLGIPPGFASFQITRDTVRQLLVLQNDISRMLPGLNALNSGNNTSSNGQ